MKHRITHNLTAIRLEEQTKRRHVSGHGEAAKFDTVSLGWWLWLPGNTSIFLGDERPAGLDVGAKVTLSVEWEEKA